MKKVFSVLGYIVLIALLLFAFCGNIVFSLRDSRQAAYDEGYEAGYKSGYDEACNYLSNLEDPRDGEYYSEDALHEIYMNGFDEGADAAKNQLRWLLEDALWDLINSSYKKHKLSAEDAIDTVLQYFEGEPISEDEAYLACEIIKNFFYSLDDLIRKIPQYGITP